MPMTTTDHRDTTHSAQPSERARVVSHVLGSARSVLTAGKGAGTALPAPLVTSSPVALEHARATAVLATLAAREPRAVRNHATQAAAARACARYAGMTTRPAERARYLEAAGRFAALALHLSRLSTGDRLSRTCWPSAPSSPHTCRRLTAGPDLSDPSRRPRQRPPGPACPHERARTLLAAPGAPNGPHPAAAA